MGSEFSSIENQMSYVVEAVKVYATVGEIRTIMCDEYQPGSAV